METYGTKLYGGKMWKKHMEKRVGKPKLPSRYGKKTRRTHGNKMDSVGKELKRGVCVFQLNVETSLNLSNQKYITTFGENNNFFTAKYAILIGIQPSKRQMCISTPCKFADLCW